MMGENLESCLLDKPRSGTKRPFHDKSATSQAHDRQDLTHPDENGLTLLGSTNSRAPSAPSVDGEVRSHAEEVLDNDSHIKKRSRTSDWPLTSANTACTEAPSTPQVAQRDRYDTLNPTSPPDRVMVKPRPSKFVEGSMNDRASLKPQPWYISGPEQNFHGDTHTRSQLDGFRHHTNRSAALSVARDKSEMSRPSSIFRFGKSVAAAFNPSSWKIWSKQHEEETQDRRILRERHEKAEKIYKELKRTGELRGSVYENHQNNQDKSISLNKHDSGVDLEHRSSTIDSTHRIGSRTMEASIEEKRYARIFLDPPGTCSFQRDQSPASEISIPLGKSSSQNGEPMLNAGEMLNGPQALRRLPSRKDLQKQQKLVKRVSDLEGKLEAARRQLAEALGEPVPAQAARISRSRFTPGTLASLPSERLLGVHKALESKSNDADASVEIGKAISIDNRTSHFVANDKQDSLDIHDPISTTSQCADVLAVENALVGSSVAENRRHTQEESLEMAEDGQVEHALGDAHQEISENLTPARQTIKRRKSIVVGADGNDGGPYRPTLGVYDDSSEAPKPSLPEKGPGRPRKLQKVEPEPKSLRPDPTEAKYPSTRAVMEGARSRSNHARTAKSLNDRRAVLSKKPTSSANNSRVPRKGRYSTSPPPLMPSSGITYTGQEISAGKTTEEHSDNVNGDQKRSQIINTDVKNSRSKSKQAFEWPADVF